MSTPQTHFVEIDPICTGKANESNGVCPKCKLKHSDQVIFDANVLVDETLMQSWHRKHLEKIADRLPQLLMFSTPYYHECGRRGVWVALYPNVYAMVHEPVLLFMVREMLVPFERDLSEGPTNVLELIDTYNPSESVVLWIRVENGTEVAEEESKASKQQKEEDGDLNGSVTANEPNKDFTVDTSNENDEIVDKEKEKPERYSLSYSMAAVLSIQAVAKAKQKRQEEVDKMSL